MGKQNSGAGAQAERSVLEALKEKAARYGDEAEILRHKTDLGTVEILTVQFTRFGEHLDTVTGEFFFRPVPGDPDGARFFCSVLTLRDDVPADNVPELALALSMINFYAETGCFALNKPADLLVFKMQRYFSGDTEEPALLKECLQEADLAYETAARYVSVVLALAEGSLSAEQFMGMIETG